MLQPAKKWTAFDEAALVQLAQDGLPRGEIAQRLRRSIGAVETRASKLGIKMKSYVAAISADTAPRLRKYFEAFGLRKKNWSCCLCH